LTGFEKSTLFKGLNKNMGFLCFEAVLKQRSAHGFVIDFSLLILHVF
jgi:hypothetical protein